MEALCEAAGSSFSFQRHRKGRSNSSPNSIESCRKPGEPRCRGCSGWEPAAPERHPRHRGSFDDQGNALPAIMVFRRVHIFTYFKMRWPHSARRKVLLIMMLLRSFVIDDTVAGRNHVFLQVNLNLNCCYELRVRFGRRASYCEGGILRNPVVFRSLYDGDYDF